jgi:hypothetical protein
MGLQKAENRRQNLPSGDRSRPQTAFTPAPAHLLIQPPAPSVRLAIPNPASSCCNLQSSNCNSPFFADFDPLTSVSALIHALKKFEWQCNLAEPCRKTISRLIKD